jgi:BirA family biotin operon repressor/biotin-[acetyl-CoA-carboxylase] ligase
MTGRDDLTLLPLKTPWGGNCWSIDETSSTMSLARELEARGEPVGSVVMAGRQTQGVGRHAGRRWESPRGEGLLFTITLRGSWFSDRRFAPSLTVGVGVCQWLASLPWSVRPSIALKWPNDVYLDDQKVAGILLQSRFTGADPIFHVGMGINLLQTTFEGDFRRAPTSLSLKGLSFGPNQALEQLLPFLRDSLQNTDAQAACEPWLWRLGQWTEVSLPGQNQSVAGTVLGLDASGRIRMATPAGEVALSSGE